MAISQLMLKFDSLKTWIRSTRPYCVLAALIDRVKTSIANFFFAPPLLNLSTPTPSAPLKKSVTFSATPPEVREYEIDDDARIMRGSSKPQRRDSRQVSISRAQAIYNKALRGKFQTIQFAERDPVAISLSKESSQ